jgi:hypothetical protein
VGDNGYDEEEDDFDNAKGDELGDNDNAMVKDVELHGGSVSSGNGEYGRGVSSCARLSSRTPNQTDFFADIENDEVDDLDNTTENELDDYGNDEDAMDDDNDATDDDDEHLKTKEQMTALHAARMALKESKRIAAERRLKATYENADKYQAEFHRLFEVSLPPDEDYNFNLHDFEEVFIKSSMPSDSILFPKHCKSKNHHFQRPKTTDPGNRQCISSRAFNVTKFMLESGTDFGIIRITGTSVNLYDTVEKDMIAMRACIHKTICDVNDQYPDMIVSVLSKIEVSMPSSQRPNRVDAHGVIIIKRTCNSLQFADDFETKMIDRGAMCRDMHNVDHTKVEVVHGIGRYHSLFIWISYVFKVNDKN